MKPQISVCIPVYGTEPLLEQCLQSVAAQDFDSAEIVIVNVTVNSHVFSKNKSLN